MSLIGIGRLRPGDYTLLPCGDLYMAGPTLEQIPLVVNSTGASCQQRRKPPPPPAPPRKRSPDSHSEPMQCPGCGAREIEGSRCAYCGNQRGYLKNPVPPPNLRAW